MTWIYCVKHHSQRYNLELHRKHISLNPGESLRSEFKQGKHTQCIVSYSSTGCVQIGHTIGKFIYRRIIGLSWRRLVWPGARRRIVPVVVDISLTSQSVFNRARIINLAGRVETYHLHPVANDNIAGSRGSRPIPTRRPIGGILGLICPYYT